MDNKERKIGDILKTQKFGLDKDALWSGMAEALPQEKQKRRGFWWLLLLMIPISYGAYQIVRLETIQENKNSIQLADEMHSVQYENENILADNNPKVDNNSNEVNSSNHSDQQRIIKLKEARKTKEWLQDSRLELLKNQSNNTSQNKNLAEVDKFASTNINEKTTEIINSNLKANNAKRKEFARPVLAPLIIKSLPYIVESDPNINLELDAHLTSTLCCIDRNWSVMILGGALKSFSKVSGITDRETGLYGASLDVHFNYHLQRRWTISGGIIYNQLNTRYVDQSEKRILTKKEGISEIMIDALGVSQTIQGPIEKITLIKRDINWHRMQNSFDFQVQLQKDIILTNKLKIGAIAGIAYNISTKTSGFAYNETENFDFFTFESDDGQNYKPVTGFKPVSGVELSYILKNLELVFRANYKWNLNPINTQIENYQIKHSQTGIQLGTRYYLNGN